MPGNTFNTSKWKVIEKAFSFPNMQSMTDSKKDDSAPVSFLNEAQLEGKAQGEVKMDLDEALSSMHKIISDEDLAVLSAKSDEDWDPIRMAIYCHDCRAIVPPGIFGKGKKNKNRLRNL